MKLSVAERVVLLDLLANERGSFSTLRTLRTLRENLAFDKDAKKFSLVEELSPNGTGTVRWDQTIPQDTEIPIDQRSRELITAVLQRMDAAGTLSNREFSLCEKFLEGKT